MSNHALKPLTTMTLAYSDGACRGNGVASNAKGGFGAVIILSNGEQIDISGGEANTTNNRMELMGAIAAVEHSPTDKPLQLWTDSSYVQNGITKWIHGWKKNGWRKADKKPVLNVELWQRLDALCQSRQIDWQWVKGHAGHTGNEYADKLANQGIDNLPNGFTKHVIAAPISTTNKQATSLPTDKKKDPMTTDLNPSLQAPIADSSSALDLPPDYRDIPAFEEGYIDYEMMDLDSQGDAFINLLDEVQEDKLVVSNQVNSTIAIGNGQLFGAFVDTQGHFVTQDETLIAKRPVFDGNTTQPNSTFVPLLPIAKNKYIPNRQLILDTETTGFDAQNGDRIIEVGIVELINRRFTGEKLHVYINPHRDMDDEVIRVHGIHSAFLAGMPTFEQVGQALYDFLQGAELIAHNAGFDMNFLQAEFGRLGLPDIMQSVTVTDSLAIAKQLYVGQRNTLDALVKRLNVGKQDRTFHGALLDAEILAEVYLAMTGGQVSLAIDDEIGGVGGVGEHVRFTTAVKRYTANAEAESAHMTWLKTLVGKNPQLAETWHIVSE